MIMRGQELLTLQHRKDLRLDQRDLTCTELLNLHESHCLTI